MNNFNKTLSGSKAFEQLTKLNDLLINSQEEQFKLFVSDNSILKLTNSEREYRFSMYLFYFENNEQRATFDLKIGPPTLGYISIYEFPYYASPTSFQAGWNVASIKDTKELIKFLIHVKIHKYHPHEQEYILKNCLTPI
jgi:hypothetical protein